MNHDLDPAPPAPGVLRSAADFHAALGWAVERAIALRSRRLVWVDPDFALWSLDDLRLLQAMTRWLALPQRRLVLVAHTYAAVERRHPRFVAWRRDWSHAVDAWSPETGVELTLPTLWIDDRGTTVQVFDTTHWRGRAAHDDAAVRQWQGEIDALLQRSEAAFPVHPLGL